MNDAQCQLIAALVKVCPEIDDIKDDVELFIKPIDDVQGEERDIILISYSYGRTSNNVLHPNLGLVSAPSGDKRINVLMTRSRCRTEEIFSSFDHTDWQATTSPGIEALRFYMINAQRGPQGYHGRPCTAPLEDWLNGKISLSTISVTPSGSGTEPTVSVTSECFISPANVQSSTKPQRLRNSRVQGGLS